MKVVKREHHQVISYFTYELDDEQVIEQFGSLERFRELLDEFDDDVWEFLNDHDYDREDDWWTDRKGGYDVDFQIEED